jgi:hypothetical protein
MVKVKMPAPTQPRSGLKTKGPALGRPPVIERRRKKRRKK